VQLTRAHKSGGFPSICRCVPVAAWAFRLRADNKITMQHVASERVRAGQARSLFLVRCPLISLKSVPKGGRALSLGAPDARRKQAALQNKP